MPTPPLILTEPRPLDPALLQQALIAWLTKELAK